MKLINKITFLIIYKKYDNILYLKICKYNFLL